MACFRRQLVDGQLVKLAHVRLWMLAVPVYAGSEGSRQWWGYVNGYRVVAKCGRHLADGSFEKVILEGFALRGRSMRHYLPLLKRGLGW